MPPIQKVEYEAAKHSWDQFWKGHWDLGDLFKQHVSKVCMVAPERSEVISRSVALLQRYLMVQHLKRDKEQAH
jgi:hypothetical protein